MAPNSEIARLLNSLLVASVIAAVSAFPIRAFVENGEASAVLESKAEKSADSEKCGGNDADLGLFAVPGTSDASLSPVYAYRLADDSVDSESALGSAHFERGPPSC